MTLPEQSNSDTAPMFEGVHYHITPIWRTSSVRVDFNSYGTAPNGDPYLILDTADARELARKLTRAADVADDRDSRS